MEVAIDEESDLSLWPMLAIAGEKSISETHLTAWSKEWQLYSRQEMIV